MAGARHIGKLVLTITPPARAVRIAAGARTESKGSVTADSISPSEGIAALERIMAAGAAQMVVSPRPLQPIIDHVRGNLQAAAPAGAAAAAPKPSARKLYPRPSLGNAYLAPRTPAETKLADVWQGLLGIEQVGVQDNFFELGGDSLIGVQVLSRVKKDFAVNLSSSALYEGPTIEALAQALEAAKK